MNGQSFRERPPAPALAGPLIDLASTEAAEVYYEGVAPAPGPKLATARSAGSSTARIVLPAGKSEERTGLDLRRFADAQVIVIAVRLDEFAAE
jgi:hypothetical protein